MNDAAIRRQQLLEETRKLYRDTESVPLVHPRFSMFSEYTTTNIDETKEPEVSSFKIRLVLSAMLFASFVTMDYYGYSIGNCTSEDITEVVSTEINIEEVWNTI